jgi:hypothetical protein
MRRIRRSRFAFEIVRQAIDPGRYNDLLALCPQRPPNRRWLMG